MKLPDADWRHRDGLDRLTDALGAGEGLVRYVGGVVRDTLLGLPVADIDLATILTPDESSRRIRHAGFKAVPTGISHGTITAVLPDGPVEVTTLRRDVATDGRHAEVAFTDDWREDAARRDFTINALSADPRDGTIHDYFGGESDLADRRVRFIGAPLERIAEDHLRILRFFRFHARFGEGPPDVEGLDACTARANDLMALSRERIAQEMLRLLGVADPAPTLAVMIAHGILRPVLPEIDEAGVARLAALVRRERGHGDAVRRLAALLPTDKTIAESVAVRLKLSNAQRMRLSRAADAAPKGDPRAIAYAVGVESARDLALLRGSEADFTNRLAALDGWSPPRLPLTGGDLIGMGLTAGPIVAATLRRVELRWVAEGFPDSARARAIAEEEVERA